MAVRAVSFSPEKALESALYIATRVNNATLHEVLKLRYFADKIHLADYGFLASGDKYVAMKFGPVASSLYDLLKAARGDESGWLDPRLYEITAKALQVERGSNRVVALREPRLEYLSKSDLRALDAAISRYGGMQFSERTDLSHDDAWKAAWKAAQEEGAGQSPMPVVSIAKTLENADELVDHLTS